MCACSSGQVSPFQAISAAIAWLSADTHASVETAAQVHRVKKPVFSTAFASQESVILSLVRTAMRAGKADDIEAVCSCRTPSADL